MLTCSDQQYPGRSVFLAGILAVVFDDLEDVLTLSGSIGAGPIAFVLPPIAYMNVCHGDKTLKRRLFTTAEGWAVIVLSCFVLSTIVVVVANLTSSFFVPGGGGFPGDEEPSSFCGEICETLPPGSCGDQP